MNFICLILWTFVLTPWLWAAPSPVVNPDDLDPEWDFWENSSAEAVSPDEVRRMSSLNSELRGPTKAMAKAKVIKILIDPGHGGKDYGTRAATGFMEKKLSLRLSQMIKTATKKLLEKNGWVADIRLTRDEDSFLSLRDRTRLANTWEADLFLSVHANSEPSGNARGFEVYFTSPESTDKRANRLALVENSERAGIPLPSNPIIRMLADSQNSAVQSESSRFAEVMFDVMASYLESSVRAVRQAPFAVLNHTVMPSLLIEVGYLSHPRDAKRLKNPLYLKKVAGAISQGIWEYTNRQPRKRRDM